MANYVAASAFGDHTHTLVCRVFGNLMAARTDGAGCNGGRLPEAGDWAGDVHRDAARAPGLTKHERGTKGRATSMFAWVGAGVVSSKGFSLKRRCFFRRRAGGTVSWSQSTRNSSFLPFCLFLARRGTGDAGARGRAGRHLQSPARAATNDTALYKLPGFYRRYWPGVDAGQVRARAARDRAPAPLRLALPQYVARQK